MPVGTHITGGLIWNDQIHHESKKGKKGLEFRSNVRPKEGYIPPDKLRSFRDLPRIGFDIETLDPDLETKGPGAHRSNGFITGTAIAYGRNDATYYPTRHAGLNMRNPERFYDHLREEALNFKGEMVGANLQYDLDWMWKRHNIKFPHCKLRDVQTAEPLLDENRFSYKLDLLSNDYLGEGKANNKLKELYGPGYIKNMDNVDSGHAAEYGEGDTTLAWGVLDEQYKELKNQNLVDLFHLESRLTPLLLRMRQEGVRVDVDAAERAWEMTKVETRKASDEIQRLVGFHVEPWAADSISRAFDKIDITYPKTPTGRPSFKKAWLAAHPSKLARLIMDLRGFDKIGGTFIKNYILDGNINGRIHAMFNQLRSDEGGTVSGRFSSSYPNLQNIPIRHPVLGPLCRSIFIPEEGMLWGSADWSQIEYRFLVHYAAILRTAGSLAAVKMYHEDKKTDFHEMAAKITGVSRGEAKPINFGVVYGMGGKTMATNLGVTFDEAKAVLEIFHKSMPFMKSTFDTASSRAAIAGEISTILGRKRRFKQWEYGKKIYQSKEAAYEMMDKLTKEGNAPRGVPRRAFTHKALNALLQGSAADLMKKAMVEMYEGGVFDVLVPHLTIHDEMNVSVPDTKVGHEAFAELTHIMETSLKLRVPILADAKTGINWNEAH